MVAVSSTLPFFQPAVSSTHFLTNNFMSRSNSELTPVLMYHAVDEANAPAADPHYTVSRSGFTEHLRQMRAAGRRGTSVRNLLTSPLHEPAVAITFDDGHVSNLHAAETLAAVEMSADFFINPSTVGTPGFLSWDQLREMQAMGMSIQSHGQTHRYLNDLSLADVRAELVDSKAAIEQELDGTVTLFAPPGGRMPDGFAALAYEAGYAAVCSSAVGFWSTTMAPAGQAVMIPRLAVLAGTNAARFTRWLQTNRLELLMLQSRSTVLTAAKRAVGNQRYEKLRQAIVGGPAA